VLAVPGTVPHSSRGKNANVRARKNKEARSTASVRCPFFGMQHVSFLLTTLVEDHSVASY
jgi:hypothetical protein